MILKIPMVDLYDYLKSLRDQAGCRDVQISLDTNLNAVAMTLRFEDGTRRFTYADPDILASSEDFLFNSALDASDERAPREGL